MKPSTNEAETVLKGRKGFQGRSYEIRKTYDDGISICITDNGDGEARCIALNRGDAKQIREFLSKELREDDSQSLSTEEIRDLGGSFITPMTPEMEEEKVEETDEETRYRNALALRAGVHVSGMSSWMRDVLRSVRRGRGHNSPVSLNHWGGLKDE